MINVLHLPHRDDRLMLLMKEFKIQQIKDYKLWPGIIDKAIKARGISRAHKQIVQAAKDSGLPDVLICEDDAMFTRGGAFQYYLTNKPTDFDIYFGFVTQGIIQKNCTVRSFRGMVFYTVSAKFYDTFLNVPETYDIDSQLENLGRYVVCYPFPVKHRDGYSDHKGLITDYSIHYRNRKFF